MLGSGVSFVTSMPDILPPWLGVVKPYSMEVWLGIVLTLLAFAPLALTIMRASSHEVDLFRISSWMQNIIFSKGLSQVIEKKV